MKFVLILLLGCFAFSVNAHPGNTASDGCHYCWTNCDYWGETYGVRHCHYKTDEPSFLDVNTSIEHPEKSKSKIMNKINLKLIKN